MTDNRTTFYKYFSFFIRCCWCSFFSIHLMCSFFCEVRVTLDNCANIYQFCIGFNSRLEYVFVCAVESQWIVYFFLLLTEWRSYWAPRNWPLFHSPQTLIHFFTFLLSTNSRFQFFLTVCSAYVWFLQHTKIQVTKYYKNSFVCCCLHHGHFSDDCMRREWWFECKSKSYSLCTMKNTGENILKRVFFHFVSTLFLCIFCHHRNGYTNTRAE